MEPLCYQWNLLRIARSHAPALSTCWCVCVRVSDYALEYDLQCTFYQPLRVPSVQGWQGGTH